MYLLYSVMKYLETYCRSKNMNNEFIYIEVDLNKSRFFNWPLNISSHQGRSSKWVFCSSSWRRLLERLIDDDVKRLSEGRD